MQGYCAAVSHLTCGHSLREEGRIHTAALFSFVSDDFVTKSLSFCLSLSVDPLVSVQWKDGPIKICPFVSKM